MYYTMSEIHSQWHSVHGQNTVCPLDCGVGEDYQSEYEWKVQQEEELRESQQAFITRQV